MEYGKITVNYIYFYNLGTQHGKDVNASDYYTSNSNIPHMPFITGYAGTHSTFRFMTISEQTLVVIGEGKFVL